MDVCLPVVFFALKEMVVVSEALESVPMEALGAAPAATTSAASAAAPVATTSTAPSPARQHVARGVVCALAGGVCWGFSGTCAQLLMGAYGIPALWVTCVRLAVSAALFLIVIAVRDRRNFVRALRDGRSLVRIVAFAFFGVVLTQIGYLNTISYTNAGTGTAIEQIGLAFIMIYACVRARRAPRVREVAGLLFALLGMFALAMQGDLSNLAIPPEGLAWGLLSAFALALYTLLPVKALEKWGPLVVTGLAMLIGGIATSVVVRPWSMQVELSAGAVAALAAIVLVGTLGAYLLYLQGVIDAGPVKASLLGSVEPVAALVISFFWLHEPISLWDAVGCAAIVVMVFLVTGRDRPVGEGSARAVAPPEAGGDVRCGAAADADGAMAKGATAKGVALSAECAQAER